MFPSSSCHLPRTFSAVHQYSSTIPEIHRSLTMIFISNLFVLILGAALSNAAPSFPSPGGTNFVCAEGHWRESAAYCKEQVETVLYSECDLDPRGRGPHLHLSKPTHQCLCRHANAWVGDVNKRQPHSDLDWFVLRSARACSVVRQ